MQMYNIWFNLENTFNEGNEEAIKRRNVTPRAKKSYYTFLLDLIQF